MPGLSRAALIFLAILVCAACRQQQPTAADIQLELAVDEERVGETMLRVTVTDGFGARIADPGALSVRGDMNHAGMVPVFAQADTADDGVFHLPFAWAMAGDWIVEATLTLPNGAVAARTFALEIASDATGEMDHDAMTGETSAAYMRVSNRGDRDITLLSAASSGARQVAFHRTVIAGDIARMEALDGLRVPARATLALQPGGAHIMLMGLTSDLESGSQLPLRFTCDGGMTYDLAFSVQSMRMGDLDDAVEIGDLVFENRWARPASAGMNMDADSG